MILLLVLALSVLAVTVWWLGRPLWRPVESAALGEKADLEQVHARLLYQIEELKSERADHGMDEGAATREEQRLTAELAAVLKKLEGISVDSSSSHARTLDGGARWRWALILCGTVAMLGTGLYVGMNASNLKGFWMAAETGAAGARVPPMVFEMVQRLEKKLAENPDDAIGWARLARSYVVLERKDKALEAYARAYKLNPDNPEVLSDYAWILFNDNPQVTTGLVSELYTRLNRLQPDHPDALWFAGFAALQEGKLSITLKHWERLLKLMPANDPARAQLQQAIQGVRERAKR